MRLFYIYFFFNVALVMSAQNYSGIAKYKIIIDTENSLWNKPDAPSDLKELLKNIDKSAVTLEPTLLFSKEFTVFSIKGNTFDNIQKMATKTICNCYKPIYSNLVKKERLEFNGDFKHLGIKEDEYLIIDSLNTNWKLYNESKIINNYKCYKATLVEIVNEKSKLITAWYCPQIPVSSGPKGYGGLPGLIFELQDKNVIFGLIEITLNNTTTIDLPNSDKKVKISSYEFNQLIAKKSKDNSEYTNSLEGKKMN